MTGALTHIYEKWRARSELRQLPESVEAPLLVDVREEYHSSSNRLVYIGQETRGWDHGKVKTVCDFLTVPDAVAQLLQGYRQFNFAENYRGRNSPFWQFFRKLSAGLAAQPIWTDLVRFDVNYGDDGSRSVLRCDPELRTAILQSQRGLLTQELSELAPDVCLFVTGPEYDSILEDEFQGIERSEVIGLPEHQLAKLSHQALPERTFRTYHPKYLRMSGLERSVLNALLEGARVG